MCVGVCVQCAYQCTFVSDCMYDHVLFYVCAVITYFVGVVLGERLYTNFVCVLGSANIFAFGVC